MTSTKKNTKKNGQFQLADGSENPIAEIYGQLFFPVTIFCERRSTYPLMRQVNQITTALVKHWFHIMGISKYIISGYIAGLFSNCIISVTN